MRAVFMYVPERKHSLLDRPNRQSGSRNMDSSAHSMRYLASDMSPKAFSGCHAV